MYKRNNKQSKSLIVCLCLASVSLIACDEAGQANLALAEGEVLIGMSPRVASHPVAMNEAISPETLEQASHLAPYVELRNGNYKPTEENVIGWIRWALGQPHSTGPITDPTGAQCDVGQEGSIWYLAGTMGGPAVRECHIPPGKKLFFPLINRWCVFASEWYPDQESIDEDMPAVLEWYEYERESTCDLTLRLNGVEVLSDFETRDEKLYIQLSELFDLDINEEHWAGDSFQGGVTLPASGAGHYVQLQPLPVGDHVLEFGGSTCGDYPFETSVTYLLHVGP